MKYWKEIDKKLVREFSLSDFKSCIEFVNKIARVAEALDHHPKFASIRSTKLPFRPTPLTKSGFLTKTSNYAKG